MEPAGFWDLRAVFLRQWETGARPDRAAGLDLAGSLLQAGSMRWGAALLWLKATCGTGWVEAWEFWHSLSMWRVSRPLNE